jgi:hypothetical protein
VFDACAADEHWRSRQKQLTLTRKKNNGICILKCEKMERKGGCFAAYKPISALGLHGAAKCLVPTAVKKKKKKKKSVRPGSTTFKVLLPAPDEQRLFFWTGLGSIEHISL